MTRRTTVALTASALVLATVVGAEAWYLWGSPPPSATAERPVVIGSIDAQAAVAVATSDAAEIFSTSWQGYDAHVTQATALMTADMAARYRRSAAPMRHEVVAARSTTTTRVAASGVVRATPGEVLALLFLDQRSTSPGAAPDYTARRALVTMVHTGQGWLVANVQTG